MKRKTMQDVVLYVVIGILIFGTGVYTGYYRCCSEISKKIEHGQEYEYHELRQQAQDAWIRFLVQPYMRKKGIVTNAYAMSTVQFVKNEKVILNALELMKEHEKQKKEDGKGILQPFFEAQLAEYLHGVVNMMDVGAIPKVKEVIDWAHGIK